MSGLTRLTTPLLPENYLSLVNPMWHTDLRARIHEVIDETDDAVTLVLRPSRPLPPHRAGQHIQIGVDINGVRQWRSYSLSSAAGPAPQDLRITVKTTSHGTVSRYLRYRARRRDVVHLQPPAGDFVLPWRVPDKVLFIAAGSGITPIMSMVRTLEAGSNHPDVELVICAPTPSDVIFGSELRNMVDRNATWLTLTEHYSRSHGRINLHSLADVVADWDDRVAWVCGPAEMLDDAHSVWSSRELAHLLHMERFQTAVLATGAEGGTVKFSKTNTTAEVNGDTTLLKAGEAAGVLMPNGCRMGICRTCVLPLVSGQVRDVRTGEVHGEPGDQIQTCVSAPASAIEIEI